MKEAFEDVQLEELEDMPGEVSDEMLDLMDEVSEGNDEIMRDTEGERGPTADFGNLAEEFADLEEEPVKQKSGNQMRYNQSKSDRELEYHIKMNAIRLILEIVHVYVDQVFGLERQCTFALRTLSDQHGISVDVGNIMEMGSHLNVLRELLGQEFEAPEDPAVQQDMDEFGMPSYIGVLWEGVITKIKKGITDVASQSLLNTTLSQAKKLDE